MRLCKLNIAIEGDELPTQFRIFRNGVNPSTKGAVIFDDEAARTVVECFEKHAVDLMIDLEHLSLDKDAKAYDPDARGWFKLAVIDGELWAVDVRWNEDGADRLRKKKQRYISPAFMESEGRVFEIVNAALCAMPATDDAMPLVAASREFSNVEDFFEKVALALGLDPSVGEDAILERIAQIVASSAELATDDLEDPPVEASDDLEDPPEILADDLEDPKAMKRLTKELITRFARLEKENKANRIESLISKNTDKIPPTLEAWARSQSESVLRAFISAAPSNLAGNPTEPKRVKVVQLSNEEIKYAKMLGISLEKLKESKNNVA